MAHFLMIENWVGAVGLILPRKLQQYGHTYTFVTRNPEHYNAWAGKNGLLKQDEFGGKHPLIGLATEVLQAETNDLQALIRELSQYQQHNPVDGVLTCCDYYLETVAEVAKALQLPGPPPQAIQVARQKHLMRQAIKTAGLPNPAFVVASDLEDALTFAEQQGFPLVVKAVDLCSSEHVFAVENNAELTNAYKIITHDSANIREQQRPKEVLVEEYLQGPEYSVETISFEGETFVIGISDKSLIGYPHFIESGVMHPADLSPESQQQLSGFVQEALTAIQYTHGLTHTEVKLTSAGPRIIEINARMGGSYLFELIEMVTGIDPFQALVDLARGQKPATQCQSTGVQSAALQFLVPSKGGTIQEIQHLETVKSDPQIHRVVVDDVLGRTIRPPQNNNDFLGHVIAKDFSGYHARQKAEWAISQLNIVVE